MAGTDNERRYFKRYQSSSEFPLNLKSGTYPCRIIDYSADGICLLFPREAPGFDRSEVLHILIEEPQLDLSAEIVWTKRDEEGLAAGFRRVGPLRGSCTDFRLPDILLGLQRGMKTGILEVMRGTRLINIFFSEGDMIFASTNQDDARFGEVLLKKGRITLEQFFEGSEILKKTGKRMGTVLIELGYLKPHELIEAVRSQVEEIIVGALTAECGYFVFKEGPLPTKETITLNLSAANLIYRSIKRITSLPYVLEDFPRPNSVLVLSEDPLDLFQDIAIEEFDRKIFSRITGETTVREILALDPNNNFDGIKTLYALLSARIITVRGDQTPVPAVTPEEVVREAQSDIDPEYVKMVDETHRKLDGSGYYEVLGLSGDASGREITEAYYRLAKEFHPDRHFALPSDDLKGKLHTIFATINEAHAALSDHRKRATYDRMLAVGKGRDSVDIWPAPQKDKKQPRENQKKATRQSPGEEKKKSREGTTNEQKESVDAAAKSFTEGKIQLALGAEGKAATLFAEAVYWDDSNHLYHYYLGLALNRAHQFKEAARALEKAIQQNPRVAHYYAELGYAFHGLGYLKRARKKYEEALAMDSGNRRALAGIRELEQVGA